MLCLLEKFQARIAKIIRDIDNTFKFVSPSKRKAERGHVPRSPFDMTTSLRKRSPRSKMASDLNMFSSDF